MNGQEPESLLERRALKRASSLTRGILGRRFSTAGFGWLLPWQPSLGTHAAVTAVQFEQHYLKNYNGYNMQYIVLWKRADGMHYIYP